MLVCHCLVWVWLVRLQVHIHCLEVCWYQLVRYFIYYSSLRVFLFGWSKDTYLRWLVKLLLGSPLSREHLLLFKMETHGSRTCWTGIASWPARDIQTPFLPAITILSWHAVAVMKTWKVLLHRRGIYHLWIFSLSFHRIRGHLEANISERILFNKINVCTFSVTFPWLGCFWSETFVTSSLSFEKRSVIPFDLSFMYSASTVVCELFTSMYREKCN